MGNPKKFKLSNMMPNAWFYKLKDMNTTTTTNKKKNPHPYYSSSSLITSPHMISPSRPSYYFPSNSPLHPKALDTHFPYDSPKKVLSPSTIPPHRSPTSSSDDIVIDLPPIITKPAKKSDTTTRLRLRANSPKLRFMQRSKPRRGSGLSESFVVVKNSSNPKRDFRESMMEMIVENGLRRTRDLEELLACYLCLNSSEYHDVIVKAFEEIWLDVTQTVRFM